MQRSPTPMRRLVPHFFTALRLPLAVLFFVSFPPLRVAGLAASGACLLAAALSDYLDGFLARRLGTVSVFGKWADPLTDALFFLSVYLAFHRAGLMPLVLLILFIAREVLQYGLLRPLATLWHLDPGARTAGKIKTGLQIAGSSAIVALAAARAAEAVPAELLATASLAILVVLVTASVGSLYWYLRPVVAHAARRGQGKGPQDSRSSR